MGLNDAGKRSLFKLLAGETKPDVGDLVACALGGPGPPP